MCKHLALYSLYKLNVGHDECLHTLVKDLVILFSADLALDGGKNTFSKKQKM